MINLQVLIPTKTDDVGNIAKSSLGLEQNKNIINIENDLDCFWFKKDFGTLNDVSKYASQISKNTQYLSRAILTFPEYFEAIISVNEEQTHGLPYSKILGESYKTLRTDDNHKGIYLLTLKEPTLNRLYNTITEVENLL